MLQFEIYEKHNINDDMSSTKDNYYVTRWVKFNDFDLDVVVHESDSIELGDWFAVPNLLSTSEKRDFFSLRFKKYQEEQMYNFVKQGYADCVATTNLMLNINQTQPIYFLDRELGRKYNKQYLEIMKSKVFKYGIIADCLGGFQYSSVFGKEGKSYYVNEGKPTAELFDTKEEALAYIETLKPDMLLASDSYHAFVGLSKKDKEQMEKSNQPIIWKEVMKKSDLLSHCCLMKETINSEEIDAINAKFIDQLDIAEIPVNKEFKKVNYHPAVEKLIELAKISKRPNEYVEWIKFEPDSRNNFFITVGTGNNIDKTNKILMATLGNLELFAELTYPPHDLAIVSENNLTYTYLRLTENGYNVFNLDKKENNL